MTSIAHIVTCLQIGGLERVVVNLVKGQVGQSHRLLVVCLEEGGPFVAEIEKLGVKVLVLGKQPGLNWRTIRQLMQIFREEKIQVVHTHNPAPHFHGVLAGVLAGVPVRVHTKHGRNYPHLKKAVLLNRVLSWLTDVIVPVSDNAGDVALHVEKVNPRKIQRIWNGVDVALYAPCETVDHRLSIIDAGLSDFQFSTITRPTAGLDPQLSIIALPSPISQLPPLTIGTVARLSPEKDQLTMLAAFKIVLERWDETVVGGQSSEFNVQRSKLKVLQSVISGQTSTSDRSAPSSASPRCAPVFDRARKPTEGLQPSDSGLRTQDSGPLASCPSDLWSLTSDRLQIPRLVIVGDGPCRNELRNEASRLGIGEQVDFLGARSDIPTQLSTFDIFTLSSITEGISMTILEAMACEIPIVATDVGGNREIVNPPECGLIVPPRDPQALAEAYLELLRDPPRRLQMGRAARVRVIAQFSLNSMVQQYENLYSEILQKKSTAGCHC